MDKRFFALCANISILAQYALIPVLPCHAESIQLKMQQPKVDRSLEPVHLEGRLEQMVVAKRGDKLPLDLTRRPANKPVAKSNLASVNNHDALKLTAGVPQVAQPPKPLSGEVGSNRSAKPLQSELAMTQQTKPISGKVAAAETAKSLKSETASLQNAKQTKVETAKVQTTMPMKIVAQDKRKRVNQLSQKAFAGSWGGELLITSRQVYVEDGFGAKFASGDKGLAVVRVEPVSATGVNVEPPTIFFDKPQEVALTVKQSGAAEPRSPLSSLFGWLGLQKAAIRYVFIGGGFMDLHDALGNQWRREVTHNSVKMIGKDSLEADMVIVDIDKDGHDGFYEERVVRLFKNSESAVYAKIAIAKYNKDRTLVKQTLLEGWLTNNWTDTADKITKITDKTWKELVQLYQL